jgi:hypothetical protein
MTTARRRITTAVHTPVVIPAQAGIQCRRNVSLERRSLSVVIPAKAGIKCR